LLDYPPDEFRQADLFQVRTQLGKPLRNVGGLHDGRADQINSLTRKVRLRINMRSFAQSTDIDRC
jgi:hypothetical protein